MEKNCLHCGGIFAKPYFESVKNWQNRHVFCSRKCVNENQVGRKLSSQWKERISVSLKKACQKGYESGRLGNKEKVSSYSGLHKWVYKKLGRPTTCEHCRREGLHNTGIHWANRTGKYLKVTSDWVRLCASCHKKYDLMAV